MRPNRLVLWTVLSTPWVVGCGGSSTSSPTFADSNDPACAAAQDGHMDPRVSTSGGEPGGYVVLWPRVAPADPDGELSETASMIQNRLIAFAQEAAAGHPVDVRPEPQRAREVDEGLLAPVTVAPAWSWLHRVPVLGAGRRKAQLHAPWTGRRR